MSCRLRLVPAGQAPEKIMRDYTSGLEKKCAGFFVRKNEMGRVGWKTFSFYEKVLYGNKWETI